MRINIDKKIQRQRKKVGLLWRKSALLRIKGKDKYTNKKILFIEDRIRWNETKLKLLEELKENNNEK